MFKLFSGTANSKLSQEVAKLLHLPISQSEVIRFDNSEVRVRIVEEVKNEICIVIQPTANPTDTNLMELLLFCDALKRQEARKVIAIIPYFGYARQNIQHRTGECVSVNVVIRFLESIGFDKVYTVDLHEEPTQGLFSIPFKNITALHLLAESVRESLKIKVTKDNIAIVSPDQGGIERAREFGTAFFEKQDFPLVVIEKLRTLDHIHRSQSLDLYGNVKNKVAILVDDIVTSGGTLMHAAELCLAYGAKKVIAAIVHHDFSQKAPARLESSPLVKFFTTNTINLNEDQKFSKLEEISIAPLIVNELKTFLK